jgi:hypothetical protein
VGSASDGDTEETEQTKRLRSAEVFGEVLPDSTSDDRDDDAADDGNRDEWLRRQVPPHHGE